MWKLSKGVAVVVGVILLVLGYGAIKFKESEPIPKESSLVIGLQSGYPPFEFVDKKGQVVGFDVDLAKILAEKLDKKLLIKEMEFEGLILSLKQGKIDLIMSGMEITKSRLKEIQMVPYHGEKTTSFSLIFWEKIPKEIQALEDIAKYFHGVVSVESGTVAEAYLTSHPSIPMRSFQGALAPLIDVKLGKATADLVEPDVATYLKLNHPEIQILTIPIAEEEQSAGFGVGIKKGNETLYQQISNLIETLKSSGELKKLEDKWFKGGG